MAPLLVLQVITATAPLPWRASLPAYNYAAEASYTAMLKGPWQEPKVLIAHRDCHIRPECPSIHALGGPGEDRVE